MTAPEKSILSSKINWVQGIMAVLAVLADPDFGSLNIIPLEWLPRICWGANALTMILRTFFSGTRLSLDITGRRTEGGGRRTEQ
jgi:hypothetical protein